jgi:hypothetical protein
MDTSIMDWNKESQDDKTNYLILFEQASRIENWLGCGKF